MGETFRILTHDPYKVGHPLTPFRIVSPHPISVPAPSSALLVLSHPPPGPHVDYQLEAGSLIYTPFLSHPSVSSMKMGRSFDENVDPLARITAPPVNETPDQRRFREREEADAKKISEQIDEALKAEREERKSKRKNRLKVLLLGQSESGTLTFDRFWAVVIPRGHFRPFLRFSSARSGSFVTRISNLPGRVLPDSVFSIIRWTKDCTRGPLEVGLMMAGRHRRFFFFWGGFCFRGGIEGGCPRFVITETGADLGFVGFREKISLSNHRTHTHSFPVPVKFVFISAFLIFFSCVAKPKLPCANALFRLCCDVSRQVDDGKK